MSTGVANGVLTGGPFDWAFPPVSARKITKLSATTTSLPTTHRIIYTVGSPLTAIGRNTRVGLWRDFERKSGSPCPPLPPRGEARHQKKWRKARGRGPHSSFDALRSSQPRYFNSRPVRNLTPAPPPTSGMNATPAEFKRRAHLRERPSRNVAGGGFDGFNEWKRKPGRLRERNLRPPDEGAPGSDLSGFDHHAKSLSTSFNWRKAQHADHGAASNQCASPAAIATAGARAESRILSLSRLRASAASPPVVAW